MSMHDVIFGSILGGLFLFALVGFIKLLGHRNPISGRWEWWS